MYTARLRQEISALDPYTPGLSIEEIRQKYNREQVIKMASNENALGASPRVQEVIARHASSVFRYPRGGNPRLVQAIAEHHHVGKDRIVIGNGSDEVIDLLLRMLVEPRTDTIVCAAPCFNLYTVQAKISGISIRQCPLRSDFSFDMDGLFALVDEHTRVLFLTTPDNPSGYCPPRSEVLALAQKLSAFPGCLLLIDEAYMDFHPQENEASLLALLEMPDNVGIMRTFSKSYGLAGLRIGYGILPKEIANAFWRARLPFSVNILAEEAALTALDDAIFHEKTLQTVAEGRTNLTEGLRALGCTVWPSSANYLLFTLPDGLHASDCFQYLLQKGIIIRLLKSYNLPEHLRVTVGNAEENRLFLAEVKNFLQEH